jgi:indole-3-glycerol phosphate synthase
MVLAAGTEDLPNSKVSRTTPETQARKRWTPPTGVLGDLVQRSERRAEALSTRRKELEEKARATPKPAPFAAALATDHVSVIAEIKRASPSRGPINPELSVDAQVRAYERGGARAISVLTEAELFGGSVDDVIAARRHASLPILRKDFHVREVQLFEARAVGASAALIIARALAPTRLSDMVGAAGEIGIEALVEVRDEEELEAALLSGATLIGVNNRDLESLDVDAHTVSRVIPYVPPNCVAIAESGYGSRASVEEAARAGADAVLIGSYLSASGDPAELLTELIFVARHSRTSVGRASASS